MEEESVRKSSDSGKYITIFLVVSLSASLLINVVLIAFVIYRSLQTNIHENESLERPGHYYQVFHTKHGEVDMYGYANLPSMASKERQRLIFDGNWNQVMLVVDEEEEIPDLDESFDEMFEIKYDETLYEVFLDLYCCPENSFQDLGDCRLLKSPVIFSLFSPGGEKEVTEIAKAAIIDVTEKYGSSCEEGEVLVEDFGEINAVKVGFQCIGVCRKASFENFLKLNPNFFESLEMSNAIKENYEEIVSSLSEEEFKEFAKQNFENAKFVCGEDMTIHVYQVNSVEEAKISFLDLLQSSCQFSEGLSFENADQDFRGVCEADVESVKCWEEKELKNLKKPPEYRRY